MAAPTLTLANQTFSTSTTTQSMGWTPDVGRLYLVILFHWSAFPSMATSGWTTVASGQGGTPNTAGFAIYSKVVTASDTSVVFNTGGVAGCYGSVIKCDGLDSTSLLDGWVGPFGTSTATASVTGFTATDETLFLSVYGSRRTSNPSFTGNAVNNSYVEIDDRQNVTGTNRLSFGVAYKYRATSGTENVTATFSSTGASTISGFALNVSPFKAATGTGGIPQASTVTSSGRKNGRGTSGFSITAPTIGGSGKKSVSRTGVINAQILAMFSVGRKQGRGFVVVPGNAVLSSQGRPTGFGPGLPIIAGSAIIVTTGFKDGFGSSTIHSPVVSFIVSGDKPPPTGTISAPAFLASSSGRKAGRGRVIVSVPYALTGVGFNSARFGLRYWDGDSENVINTGYLIEDAEIPGEIRILV